MTVFQDVSPVYTVYFYTEFLYKVVKFRRAASGVLPQPSVEAPLERFSQSYSRSRRVVLQCALCNQWDYFVTITVSPEKFDRYTLKPIWDALYEFFRFYRDTYSSGFKYLLVPEYHKDGAWHFHGFLFGILPQHISAFVPGLHPQKLIDMGYANFGLLADVVGYVSLSQLRNDTAAAFYVTKYVTKEHAHDDLYDHLYYRSQGLRMAFPVSDVYCYNSTLEACISWEGDFCSTGWARLSSPDFTFPLSLDGCEPRLEEVFVPAAIEEEVEDLNNTFYFVQLWPYKNSTPLPPGMAKSRLEIGRASCRERV